MGVSLIAPRADSPRLPPNFRGVSAAPLPFLSNPFSFFPLSLVPSRPRARGERPRGMYLNPPVPGRGGGGEGGGLRRPGAIDSLARVETSRGFDQTLSAFAAFAIPRRARYSRPRTRVLGGWGGGEEEGKERKIREHDGTRSEGSSNAREKLCRDRQYPLPLFFRDCRRTEGKERRGERKGKDRQRTMLQGERKREAATRR